MKDWMSEATIKKIEERKDMKKKINSSKSARVKEKFQIEYRRLDKEVKHMCRCDKRENMNNLIEHAEKAAQMGDQGTLSTTIEQIQRHPKQNNISKRMGRESRTKDQYKQDQNNENQRQGGETYKTGRKRPGGRSRFYILRIQS